jgi:uncharacterized protein (TIGR02246 family)
MFSSNATFEFRRFQLFGKDSAMNLRKFVVLALLLASVFAASTATAQRSGHRSSITRMATRGALTSPSTAPAPMHRAPIMNSTLGARQFNGFNHGHFDRDHRFRRFHGFNRVIVIGNFAFPSGPLWGGNAGYYPQAPYDYSQYSYSPYYSYAPYPGYGSGYGNSYGYGYGYPSLLYYGGYYSATNYENDESVVRNVLAEYTVSWNQHDTAALGRLFAENGDYVDTADVHWKGVQEILQRHAQLFQNKLKSAVRRLTGAEVTFPTADVALVHATWDVTGWRRSTGEAVSALKESSTIKMAKTDGKWLITDFQDTDSGASAQ